MQVVSLTIDVFRATDLAVIDGVLIGEKLSFADELALDDVYALARHATPLRLHLQMTEAGLQHDGHIIHLDSCLTLMAPDGSTHDALVLVEVARDQVRAIYLQPLGEIVADRRYRLIGIARQTATRRFAEAQAGSFARGTRITLADGRMVPVEDLAQGDLILTRDAGKQPLRHCSQTTLRATGPFAPVVISAGALHNEQDLVLRADHRVFVYQRRDLLGAGRAEVLVKARHLVDGQAILRRPGGFVDYFQLIFDDHQIIYAEGIAAESYLVDARSKAALPAELDQPLHRPRAHLAYEVAEALIDPEQAADLLRRASTG